MTIPISQQYSLLLRLKQKRSNLEKKYLKFKTLRTQENNSSSEYIKKTMKVQPFSAKTQKLSTE